MHRRENGSVYIGLWVNASRFGGFHDACIDSDYALCYTPGKLANNVYGLR